MSNFPSTNGHEKNCYTIDVREKMKQYWMQYDPSPESMMLCSAANDVLAAEDRKQVLEISPTLRHKKVLELGAGIGRFTTELGKIASTVTAVDFIPSYIEKNKELNGHNPNISFMTADVTELELPKNSYDVIFTNWLFMYLSDAEMAKVVFMLYFFTYAVRVVVSKMLGWLNEGGYLFIRESCYRPSGDVKRTTNPTYYRSPPEYFRMLQHNFYCSERGQEFSFVCERALSIEAYIKELSYIFFATFDNHYQDKALPFRTKTVENSLSEICELLRKSLLYGNGKDQKLIKIHYGNPFQLGFILKKMSHSSDSYDSFQAFLDGQQYTEEGIGRYEFIFGKTFLSTGGQQTTEEFVKQLALKETDRVLDVGCGIGGSAFYITRAIPGSTVHGIDLSSNMISVAIKYQGEMEENVRKAVSFEMSDITKHHFEPNSFDVIYSRDTILHIGDKEELFTKFFNWLKPGGKLMITDYCRGDKEEYSEDFLKYVRQRGYHLLTPNQYGELLEKVGFQDVISEDRTAQFIDILHKESKQFVAKKGEFLQKFKESDFEYILDGWKAKIERCSAGDQAWGVITATKQI